MTAAGRSAEKGGAEAPRDMNRRVSDARRILLVTRNFPPLIGGMERLIHKAYTVLAREFAVALLGPSGCQKRVIAATPVLACPLSPTPLFLSCLHWHAIRLAQAFGPDLVIAGSGVAAPAALAAAHKTGSPAACFIHGLDVVADNWIYRKLFLPAIGKCDLVIANSRSTANLARQAGVDSCKLQVVHPGVSMPDATVKPSRGLFRALVNGHERRLLLSVGRIHPRKGLAAFVERALPALVAAYPDLLLAIVGEEPRNALLRARAEKERIVRAARSVGVEGNVVFAGIVADDMLKAAYEESDVLVFPVLDRPGDVEGFGMVAVEAAAHGLPTVAFAVGGVIDAVAENVSGRLVAAGDYDGFVTAVKMVLEDDATVWRQPCVDHARTFAWDRFDQKLLSLCANLMSR